VERDAPQLDSWALIEDDSMTTETIYMPLLGEGTDVWAPVQAEGLEGTSFRVLGPMPDDQEWAFSVGEVVDVEPRTFADGSTWPVAVARLAWVP
jgi:hypothetical protein